MGLDVDVAVGHHHHGGVSLGEPVVAQVDVAAAGADVVGARGQAHALALAAVRRIDEQEDQELGVPGRGSFRLERIGRRRFGPRQLLDAVRVVVVAFGIGRDHVLVDEVQAEAELAQGQGRTLGEPDPLEGFPSVAQVRIPGHVDRLEEAAVDQLDHQVFWADLLGPQADVRSRRRSDDQTGTVEKEGIDHLAVLQDLDLRGDFSSW